MPAGTVVTFLELGEVDFSTPGRATVQLTAHTLHYLGYQTSYNVVLQGHPGAWRVVAVESAWWAHGS